MPAAAHAVMRRGRPARPHRVCPPAEGAVPPPPHLAEQQVLARRCSTGFLLEDGGLIARVSYRARPHLSLSLLFCFFPDAAETRRAALALASARRVAHSTSL